MRELTVLVLVVGLSLGLSADVLGKQATAQEAPFPEIELVVLQETVWIGERLTWHVSLTPGASEPLEDVTVRAADATVWQLKETVALTQPVSGATTLAVEAVPLQVGTLTPALRVGYTIDGQRREALVRTAQRVNVRPAAEAVTVTFLDGEPTRVGESVTFTLRVENTGPFLLTTFEVVPVGQELTWETLPRVFSISPGGVRYPAVSAHVRRAEPTPRLEISYNWRDDLANLQTTRQLIAGPRLPTRESFWVGVPPEIFAVFLGVIASVLTTALTRLLEQRLERRAKRQVNRRRVRGLLNLMLTRAEYAADHGEPLDLDPLETLMKEEPLYATLDRYALARKVQDLWEAGEAHNHNLTKPEGLQRSRQLKATADHLKKNLKGLDTPWRTRNTRRRPS